MTLPALPADWQPRLARVLRTVNPADPADRTVVEAFLARLEQTNPPTTKGENP